MNTRRINCINPTVPRFSMTSLRVAVLLHLVLLLTLPRVSHATIANVRSLSDQSNATPGQAPQPENADKKGSQEAPKAPASPDQVPAQGSQPSEREAKSGQKIQETTDKKSTNKKTPNKETNSSGSPKPGRKKSAIAEVPTQGPAQQKVCKQALVAGIELNAEQIHNELTCVARSLGLLQGNHSFGANDDIFLSTIEADQRVFGEKQDENQSQNDRLRAIEQRLYPPASVSPAPTQAQTPGAQAPLCCRSNNGQEMSRDNSASLLGWISFGVSMLAVGISVAGLWLIKRQTEKRMRQLLERAGLL